MWVSCIDDPIRITIYFVVSLKIDGPIVYLQQWLKKIIKMEYETLKK